MACCIDVSYAQGSVNWAKVKQENIRLAVLRAGYGREYPSQVDAQFYSNIKGCQQNNIPFAIYWYAYADSVEDAIKEANACYNTIKNISGIQFVAYDVEDKTQVNLHNKDLVTNMVVTFLNFFKTKGYHTKFYSYKNFIQNNVDIAKIKNSNHGIWVADYSKNPKCFDYSHIADIWQYASNGRINGINGNVDMNICYDSIKTKIDTTILKLVPNNTYVFKITCDHNPYFVSGNTNIISAPKLIRQVGYDYYYQATGLRQGEVGFYLDGPRVCIATCKNYPVRSDTPFNYTLHVGGTYQFKFTCEANPNIVIAENKAVTLQYVKQIGNDYYYKIHGVGKINAVGIYANGRKICIVKSV